MTDSLPKPRARRLLVSIHDVGPLFEPEVDRLRALLTRHIPEDRIAMLVVPNHWGKAAITPGSPFADRLRDWADRGSELFVHGWFHQDNVIHKGRVDRFKARHMTASEGEFLGLSEAAAIERMAAGRALIEDISGRPAAGFVAPAWLYGPGALAAVASLGFGVCEDHMKVWSPASGRILCRGPVITWASRSRARIASSLAGAFLLRNALRGAGVVRLAVHPGDTREPSLLDSIERTVAALAAAREPIRYRDLAAAPAGNAFHSNAPIPDSRLRPARRGAV